MKNGRNDRGQFTGENTGRPKGSGNKLTVLQKAKIEKILMALDKTLIEDLAKLKPNERVSLWASLQEYIRLKLQRTSIDLEKPEDKITKIIFEVVPSGDADD